MAAYEGFPVCVRVPSKCSSRRHNEDAGPVNAALAVLFHGSRCNGRTGRRSPTRRLPKEWGIFELALNGSSKGNPFVDVSFSAKFTQGSKSFDVAGFYDGGGMYRVLLHAHGTGRLAALKHTPISRNWDGKSGQLTATKPTGGNHGPVKVRATYHFGYADGTPYFPFGTTAYAWTSQGDTLEEQTLATLKAAPFNKIRMCVFPKRYTYNANEPVYYPFELQGEGRPPDNKNWDFTHFNPIFFQHLEKRIGQLRDLGIEADLILFHPYDRGAWGFDRMPKEVDDRYLRYLIARLGAYRNIWWSLANEFDFMTTKTDADWARFFQIVHASDPYGHLTSIHNGSRIYNDTLSTVTHASIQNGSAAEDVGRASIYREAYGKPIMLDEVKYEGNIVDRFGSLSAQERCRTASGSARSRCVYVTHGETYMDPLHDVFLVVKGRRTAWAKSGAHRVSAQDRGGRPGGWC